MIIDRTYFCGDLYLPFSPDDVGTSSLLVSEERAEFDLYLAEKEDEFLSMLFGNLKEAYVAGRGTSPWVAVDAYVINSDLKTSIIANYVYFRYWNSRQYGIDDSGTFVKEREKGVVVSNSKKTIDAWNAMIKKILPLLAYLMANRDALIQDDNDFTNSDWDTFVDGIENNELQGNYLNEYGL